MPFNVQNFLSHLGATGTLQTNKFEMRITTPPMLIEQFRANVQASETNRLFLEGLTQASNTIRLRAQKVSIPGITTDTYETRRYGIGPKQKFGTNASFADFSASFIEDGKNNIFKYFYYWNNLIADTGGVFSRSIGRIPSYNVGYKSDYATSIDVIVYDNDGKEQNSIFFKDAFPVSFGDTPLDWSNNNSLFKVDVTFAYSEWSI